MAALRSLRLFRGLALPLPASTSRPFLRPLTMTAVLKADSDHSGPPQLLGPGGKPGQVPTDMEQATGLERFELLGRMEGVDVFDMRPLEMDRIGTVQDPWPIYSLFPHRQVGCTGYPADSHDTIWLTVEHSKKANRCPECGCVFSLNFQGDPHLLEEGAHHH